MKTYKFYFFEPDGSGNDCILSGPNMQECIDYFFSARPGCAIYKYEER